MSFRIFDTHAHMSDPRFDGDRDTLLTDVLPQQGVELVADVACDLRTADATVRLLDKYDYVYGVVGMHPHYACDMSDDYALKLEQYLAHPKMLAVGEIGLDYHYDFSQKSDQIRWFDYQLCVAEAHGLPVVLHIREAYGDCMDILRAHKCGIAKNGGIVHCFSGSREIAFECIDMGLAIGVGGSLTFTNAHRLVDVVRDIPVESIVFETDCPYMTPVPFRGERNDPSFIRLVAIRAAEIRGMTTERLADIAFENGCRVYRLNNR